MSPRYIRFLFFYFFSGAYKPSEDVFRSRLDTERHFSQFCHRVMRTVARWSSSPWPLAAGRDGWRFWRKGGAKNGGRMTLSQSRGWLEDGLPHHAPSDSYRIIFWTIRTTYTHHIPIHSARSISMNQPTEPMVWHLPYCKHGHWRPVSRFIVCYCIGNAGTLNPSPLVDWSDELQDPG